jgi:hypothetical protein
VGLVVEGTTGVILHENPVFYADGKTAAGGCQVLTEEKAVWVLSASLTKQYEAL